jgi:hypothetical protein
MERQDTSSLSVINGTKIGMVLWRGWRNVLVYWVTTLALTPRSAVVASGGSAWATPIVRDGNESSEAGRHYKSVDEPGQWQHMLQRILLQCRPMNFFLHTLLLGTIFMIS